jgi:hypothetical protein
MNEYIQNSIRNNLRCIIRDLTLPQQKSISEVVRGLFTTGMPILSKLAQDENKTAKKQSEKYSYHLGRIDLTEKMKDFAFRKAKQMVRKTTIIAYDLTDIAKHCANKMEKLKKVFDGSKRKTSNGYELHGVGINGILTRFEFHDDDTETRNQKRKEIVREISEKLDYKGIWVFDRGNDDKQFFIDLRHILKVDFIARLKENRQVVMAKTGEIIKVKDVLPGKYEVYLMNRNNNKADTRYIFTLIISKHLEDKEPIRLISNMRVFEYTQEQFVTMYLERWGVENIYRRAKTKFELEKIRVLKYQRLLNLVALIQFAVIVSSLVYEKVRQATNSMTACIRTAYRKFLKVKYLTFNADSFIAFMRHALSPLVFRRGPPKQLSLFSFKQVKKLGII